MLILLSLIILAVLSFLGYFIFMTDDSKVAEKILDNPPELQNDSKIIENKISPDTNLPEKIKSGEFIKIDPLHYASGGVSVEKFGENYKIKFENNFSAANGPDLYVYISEPQNYRNIALGGVDTSKTLNLGALKKQKSAQEYLVSKKDFEKYGDSVIIWCKQFGVQFSRADLK